MLLSITWLVIAAVFLHGTTASAVVVPSKVFSYAQEGDTCAPMSVAPVHSSPRKHPIPVIVRHGDRDSLSLSQKTNDSIFLNNSRPIIFTVNKTFLHADDQVWLRDTIRPVLDSLGTNGIILVRATASPEGPVANNERLANGRRDAAMRFLQSNGVDVSKFHIDVVIEDYELLLQMMRQNHDPAYATVFQAWKNYGTDYLPLKRYLQGIDGGKLWNRLLKEYFPDLRAVRMMLIDLRPPKPVADEMEPIKTEPIVDSDRYREYVEEEEPEDMILPRREVWNVKTNLLEWAAYVPQYGYCPMPNVTVEYYPLHGHFTYAASFDCPWWQGDITNHKYFQLRNYTLEARYYFKSGDVEEVGIGNGHAFRHWYVGAYGHAFLYGIGFSKYKGWQGEGVGAGLSAGYVLPLGKSRWSLDFSAQVGFFRTGYDPYIYGIPVLDGQEDGLYYYDWSLDPDFFKERQYRFNWIGPTRVSITLNYDLLYRPTKSKKKGLSFRRWEKPKK